MTALLALRPFSDSELERAARVLAAEGLGEMRATLVVLSSHDAQAVSDGDSSPIAATLLPDKHQAGNPDTALTKALETARARGTVMKEELLADPEMLNTAAMAERLGMSEEGVRLKRKRHEVLGLEFAKRGIRYPGWQVLPDRQLLPGLPRLFAILGDDPWRMLRFLRQHHGELGGARALDALRHGQVEAVLAAAENIATGAFA